MMAHICTSTLRNMRIVGACPRKVKYLSFCPSVCLSFCMSVCMSLCCLRCQENYFETSLHYPTQLPGTRGRGQRPGPGDRSIVRG